MSQATKPGTEAADARAGTLHVRAWSEEEFATSREAWERLLRASGADPLFMSWDWQWRWWTHHARALGATLRLVAVYTASDELVGLAPFYSRRVSVRRILRSCRIELIGIAWRDPSAVFSDYLDLIVAPPHCDAVLALIASWLAAQTFWQELVFACIRQDSLASMFVRTHLAGIAYVREVDGLNAWSARLPKQFEDYIAGLTSDARRKLFTHRHRLSHPRLEYADETNIPEFLDLLWCYTTLRWGLAAGGAHQRAFHAEFAACMAREGRLRLSRLTTREGPVSVMYNVHTGDTVHYLQSGFDRVKARGLSLGYLHFGYAIEKACDEGAERFDFLAGRGRHRDYKRDLLTDHIPVVTYHVVRGATLRFLHAAHDIAARIGGS